MVAFAKITVFLLDGSIVIFEHKTLLEVAKECLQHPLANKNPLLIKITEENKLYFNTDLFSSWVKKEIDLAELLEHVKVDALVRNKEDLFVDDFKVEKNSLWLQKENLCILENTDNFYTVPLDNRFKLLN